MNGEVGYWKWAYGSITGFSKFIYNELKPLTAFFVYTLFFWLIIYVLTEIIFDWYLTKGYMFGLLLLLWVIPSLLIMSYMMYLEDR